MLQSLRESMKGVVAKVVVGLVVAAMVLFGVESLFVNSVGGSDVATVNGEDVPEVELFRAVEQQKSRLRQQFQLEEDNEMLSDERLRQPALMNLVRQKAILQTATAAGMNVSPEIVKSQLAQAFSRDGQFDPALMNNYINSFGYTPATLAEAEADSYVLRQLYNGLNGSEFLTSVELEVMASVAGQKRSFSTVVIPRAKVEADVEITDAQIQEYYSANPAQFTDPEKISLEYVEVSIPELAKQQTVTDEEIRNEYERELAEFESATQLEVSHILIESNDTKITEVSEKLAAGESFDTLASEYSDDLGSKNLGGKLGLLIEDAFPEAFEVAARALAEGEISAPVKTDAGTHFIRLDKKTVTQAPSLDSRRDALKQMIGEQRAGDAYIEKVTLLEELSFGASDLIATAEALETQVQTVPLFARGQGTGIAARPAIANAAFADDVYAQGQVSRVLELDGDRALVIRLKDKVPATLRTLEVVSESIRQQLTETEIAQQLEALSAGVSAALAQGEAAADVAERFGYEAKSFEQVERGSAEIDFSVSREVFSMARPAQNAVVTGSVSTPEGLTIIGLTQVEDGSIADLAEAQRQAMEQQLVSQKAGAAVQAFEARVFDEADYKLN